MPDRNAEFFVGYLPTPSGLRGALKITAIVILAFVGIAAVLIAAAQRDPGTGKWELGNPDQFTGVVFASPYPILRTQSETFLLIDEGKVGAGDRVEHLHGQTATIRGTRIERDQFKLIELSAGDDGIQILDRLPTGIPAVTMRANVTLRGEIIDPKCHSGAMKPGDGKAHKACATLCIRGGIPPVFLASNDSSVGERYLLVDEQGQGLTGDRLAEILPFVGDRTEIRGIAERHGELTVLKIASGAVQRLN